MDGFNPPKENQMDALLITLKFEKQKKARNFEKKKKEEKRADALGLVMFDYNKQNKILTFSSKRREKRIENKDNQSSQAFNHLNDVYDDSL